MLAKPFLSVLAVLVLSLGLLAWLILGLGISEPLVPDPENVVKGFVTRLSSGRYESAQQALGDELKARYQIDALQQLNSSLEDKLGEYTVEPGGQQDQQGDQAAYLAQVKTVRGGMREWNFQLERDQRTGLWKISSLESLEQAAQQ